MYATWPNSSKIPALNGHLTPPHGLTSSCMSENTSDREWFAEYQRKRVRGLTRSVGTNALLNERDGRRRCFACQCHFPPILNNHHIKAVANGGESWVENLVRLCPNCHALVHWANKRKRDSVPERIEHLKRYGVAQAQAFRIAMLSTEEVYVDDLGAIWPRTRLLPQETLTHVEIYEIYNWRPQLKNVGETRE
jgi:5-methylcytosine-specific restriction endonuclease McrA